MSNVIDERVLEMRFDNKQFESGVSDTLSSLDKLKRGLNMSGASKGLEEVRAAAKNCNMTGLSDAVDTVRLRFSALQVMGVTALTRITNAAMTAGKRIVSALTIDPIKTGFSEYETQLNAVQTILANTKSKGKTLTDVNKALDELNLYADKTIYNFTEMTRNIGTFTAAGVDLDTSVSAIKGIANLAAVSGSSSQQASVAMYQLSQALASGTVKLMDWNSVVNAGMGGQVFQDALKETARVHGIKVDEIIKKHGSFRESLSEGWITSEILTETLSKFTGDLSKEQLKSMGYTDKQIEGIIELGKTANDAATKVKTFTQLFDTLKEAAQSGWAQTWEIVVGDFEEAKAFMTTLSDKFGAIIGASAEARNKLLQGWKDLGGRSDLIASIENIFASIKSIAKPIKEAFQEIIPPLTAKNLAAFTTGLKEFTSNLKLSDKASANLKRTFKGLFAIVDIARQIFVALCKVVKPLLGALGFLGDVILSITAYFGDLLVGMNNTIKRSDIFNKIINGIASAIEAITKAGKSFAGFLSEKIVAPGLEYLADILEKIQGKSEGVYDTVVDMKNSVVEAAGSMGKAFKGSGFSEFLEKVWELTVTVGKAIGGALGSAFDKIGELVSNADFDTILELIKVITAGGLGAGLVKFIFGLKQPLESVSDLVGDSESGITGALGSAKDCLAEYQTQLKANILLKIAGAIAILAGSLFIISLIDSSKLLGALGGISALFAELAGVMVLFGKLNTGEFGNGLALMMLSFSVAILILSSALKKIGEMENTGKSALEVITTLLSIMTGTVVSMNLIHFGALKSAFSMIAFANAIRVLANILKSLGALSWDEISRGMVGLTACVALMVAASVIMTKSTKTLKLWDKDEVKGMNNSLMLFMGFAVAVKILGSTLKNVATLGWEEIAKGLVGLYGCVALMVGTSILLSQNAKDGFKGGMQMILMATSFKIVASAMKDIGEMDTNAMLRGILGISYALIAMVAALSYMPPKALGNAVALIAVSAALAVVASILKSIGGMSWESIAKGMVAIGGALVLLAAGLAAMKGSMVGSAALLVASAALTMLVPTLTVLGAMSWGAIVKGLVAIAGAFTILGVAAAVLGPMSVAVLGLSVSLALLGVAVLAFGAGLVAIGAGLSAIAAGFTAISASLSIIVVGIVKTVAALIVGICEGLAEGIVAFCKIITNSIPVIAEALTAVILALCDILADCVVPIAKVLLELFVGLLEMLVEYTPVLVDLLFKFIIGILDGLARHIPTVVQKAVEILLGVVKGIIAAFTGLDLGSLKEGMTAVGLIAGIIAALAVITPLVPIALVGALGMGAVVAELTVVLAALGALSNIPGLNWLISEGGYFLEAIGTAIGQFVGGITGGIAKGFTSALPEVADDLSEFMTNLEPFIDGASSLDESILSGVKSLVGIIYALTGANIIDGLTSWFTGGSALSKFGEELADLGPNLKEYSDSVSGVDPVNIKASAEAIQILSDMANNLPNSGGLMGLIAGDNDISDFGDGLKNLGKGLKSFSTETEDISPENISAAAAAAKALAEMTAVIPNSGGITAWISGENSVSNFSYDLKNLGKGLKEFSDTLGSEFNPEHITAAASAARALAEMTAVIPDTGGVVAWFAGDNSISKFAGDLPLLGAGLKGFSDSVAGITPENIIAAANAAKALAEMTAVIPNSGGVVTWFTGDNSISKFAGDLPLLGTGLKGFSDATAGIVAENIVAAANAARVLAEMTSVIPNEGGIAAWFTGEASISSFAGELPMLGYGLKGFSDATAGIVAENIVAAANAAKSLAEMTSVIPNEGGMTAWFTGESSVSKFAGQLPTLGYGLKLFSDSVTGINPENILAAANAASGLADLVAVIPNEGGMVAWFSGESSVVKFAGELPILGAGLKGFSDSVAGIVPENVTAAANSAKALAEMTAVIPKEGGIQAWFSGETSISNFADKLPTLGDGLKGFSDSVDGINPENVTAAANAAKSLGEMTETVPKNTDKIIKFGENVTKFGEKIKAYFTSMSEVSEVGISSAGKALESVKEISEIDSGNIKSVASALKDLTKAVKNMAKDIKSDLKDAGKKAIEGFVKGINDNIKSAETAAKSMVTDSADAASKKASSFESAGKSVVEGFAKGIGDNTYLAEAKARVMAKAAYLAAKLALKINSPAKIFIPLGEGTVEGYVKGVDNMSGAIDTSMSGMANNAISGFSRAILAINNFIDSDIDVQPTIRPVLDLSNVKAGAGSISGMVDGALAGALTPNLGAISSMMARRNQNGANDDVVSEISKLRKEIGEKEFANYSIGDISYREGDEVSEAIKTLLRAMMIEGRA